MAIALGRALNRQPLGLCKFGFEGYGNVFVVCCLVNAYGS